MAATTAIVTEEKAVEVTKLTFGYDTKKAPVLNDVTFSLPPGARLLLIGDNGAGKSTLLRLLAGRHIHDHDAVLVYGCSAFFDGKCNTLRAYLAGDWGKRTVAFTGHGCALQADIGVSEMMLDSQRTHAERRDMLVSLLGIDLEWRMHQLSDGQRRRVQIMLQLLRPSKLLLLDEITTDLDLITRQDFLAYMRKISEEDNVTVIYATHIFDGLDDWGTHLAYVADGRLKRFGKVDEFEDLEAIRAGGSVAPLFQCVAQWLRADRDAKKAAGKSIVEAIPPSVDELRGAAGNGYLPGRFSQGFN